MAPYFGLQGMPLVMAITLACSTGFLLFGMLLNRLLMYLET